MASLKTKADLQVGLMRAGVLHGARDIRLETRARPELAPGMVLLRVKRVGICGSDLHYFEDGYCGAFTPSRPFVLGHELVGTIEDRALGVTEPSVNARVAVNPARSCGRCTQCRAGRSNLCPETVMLGSASTNPPTDGAFAEFVTVRADQCHQLPDSLSDGLAAMVEPLAVALHAVRRSGGVSGHRVLVSGAGPIGLLVALTARAFGATSVVVSDPVASRRETAQQLGADGVLDPTNPKDVERARSIVSGGFDAVFEAAGISASLRQAFNLVRTGGTIVQIGTLPPNDVPLPANQLMVREIRLVGSFRYADVYDDAIRLLASGRINLEPLITGVWPLEELPAAFLGALEKERAIKVQITIGESAR